MQYHKPLTDGMSWNFLPRLWFSRRYWRNLICTLPKLFTLSMKWKINWYWWHIVSLWVHMITWTLLTPRTVPNHDARNRRNTNPSTTKSSNQELFPSSSMFRISIHIIWKIFRKIVLVIAWNAAPSGIRCFRTSKIGCAFHEKNCLR